MRIRVQVPASSANLGCGFDVFGLALARYSAFVFDTDLDSGPPLRTAGIDAAALQTEGCRLVYKAVEAYEVACGLRVPPFRLEVQSGIPVGRGLGSSAAAIIGGLLGADALVRGAAQSLSCETEQRRRLLELACRLEGHADNIAAALCGGLVVAIAQAARESYPVVIPLPTPGDLVAVVFLPDLPLSTAAARAILPAQVPLGDAVHNTARAALFVSIFAAPQGRLHLLSEAMNDRLHQPYRVELLPHLPDFIRSAEEVGAYGAALSGAGPSILALCPRERAEAVRVALESASVSHEVPGSAEMLEIATEGAVVEYL